MIYVDRFGVPTLAQYVSINPQIWKVEIEDVNDEYHSIPIFKCRRATAVRKTEPGRSIYYSGDMVEAVWLDAEDFLEEKYFKRRNEVRSKRKWFFWGDKA